MKESVLYFDEFFRRKIMITPAYETYSHLEPYEGREVTYALYSLPLQYATCTCALRYA